MADHVEEKIWKADNLSDDQAATLVINLPGTLRSLAAAPLASLASGDGVPGPAASFGADVAAAALLKPVLGPVDGLIHAFEVAGVIVALLTGVHPLVVTCVKYLAHDEIGSLLSRAFERVLDQVTTEPAQHEPIGPVSGAPEPSDFSTVGGKLDLTGQKRLLPEVEEDLRQIAEIARPGSPLASADSAEHTKIQTAELTRDISRLRHL
jgi:hypothetical protein